MIYFGYKTVGADVIGFGEQYHFLTEEAACIFRDILNKDLLDHQYTTWVSTVTNGCSFSQAFRANNRDIMVIDNYGNLTKLDLPYIIWSWFKLSAVGKSLKTLWYGTKHERTN